jgi:uncharacterized membrane protein YdjX (TVP38/TMEM64 family)
VETLKQLVEDLGGQYPWLLFLALVVLPGLGFPASPLLLLAGALWGCNVRSCLLAMAAVMLNIAWTHIVAAGPGHSLISRQLGDRWQRWRNVPRSDLFRLAFILRVTPGVPLFAQNYLLGLLGVPLRTSLLIALPLTGLQVSGYVLTGGAVLQGRFGVVLAGICLLLVLAIGMRLVRSRLGARGLENR